MGFLETSALEGSQVDEAFNMMIVGNSVLNVEMLKKTKTMP
jgi:hypothetical protein